MTDRSSRDDFERIRLLQAGSHPLADNLDGGGVPAFLGQVTTNSSLIGVGKFLMVQPTSVLGQEVEGESGQLVAVGSSTVPVYLVGPGVPWTGDYLVCRFVDNRWAAERSSGSPSNVGPGIPIADCECPTVPPTLAMTSGDPSCNFKMFQSCTIQYGPTPGGYLDLQIGDDSFLSVESFPDEIANGAMFQYLLTCYYNQFNLSRVYLESPYGSPYRDAILYSWLVGGYANSCNPFALDNGVAYTGSDASCFVTISAT